MQEIGKAIADNVLINELSDMLNNGNGKILDKLSHEEKLKIAKLVVVDKAKNELKNEVEKEKFNQNKNRIFSNFLRTLKSEKSKPMYRQAINEFFDFIRCHPVDVKAEQVDNYLYSDIKNIKNKKQYLSSFYSYLLRHDFVQHNYFRSAKMPKTKKRKLKVPTDADVAIMQSRLESDRFAVGRGSAKKIKSAEKNLTIFNLLVQTGIRVGALPTITCHHNQIIKMITKGDQEIEKKLAPELYKKIKNIDWLSVKIITTQKMIERISEGKYHPHSLRHYFAVQQYKMSRDIYKVSRQLDHKSIAVTECYLRSLNVIE